MSSIPRRVQGPKVEKKVMAVKRACAGKHIVTEAMVLEIRRLYDMFGMSPVDMQEKFGIKARAIEDIVSRRSWKWVPEADYEKEFSGGS